MWERSVCISQEEGMEEKKRTGETAFLTEGTASARAEGRCGVFMEPPVLEGHGGGGSREEQGWVMSSVARPRRHLS